eukprot:scaffold20775_cov109-Isochrysis_galbana.AAC.3
MHTRGTSGLAGARPPLALREFGPTPRLPAVLPPLAGCTPHPPLLAAAFANGGNDPLISRRKNRVPIPLSSSA